MSKRLVFCVVAALLLYAILEGVCWIALTCLARYKDMKYIPRTDRLVEDIQKNRQVISDALAGRLELRKVFDSELGWAPPKTYRTPWEIITNSIRDEKSYSLRKPSGVVRMLAFGDSFVYCDEVSNKMTWETFLNQTGNVEVLNFGVPGYGLDQAYLWYLREGRKYETDFVLIGFFTEDINRHVNTFRYFYSPYVWCYSKPRFYLEKGELRLQDSYFKKPEEMLKLITDTRRTLYELGQRDFYFRSRYYSAGLLDFLPSVRLFKVLSSVYLEQCGSALTTDGRFNTGSEAYLVTEKLFDAFGQAVQQTGARPVILLFPDKEDFLRLRSGKPKRYQPLLDDWKKKGYAYIDLMDAFDKYCPGCDLKQLMSNHFSPHGNMIISKYMVEYFMRSAAEAAASGRKGR
ncbi:MAG: SGNH/GDSL hydrolase family protein [Candidatus Omnitrophica bacterium]|nr:SGNH/GDSL hydrolase family protein [Candidatus Omnitrophota bacterium]